MLILYGAGTTGRVIVRDLKAKGIECVLTDSDVKKWGKVMEGVEVLPPTTAKNRYPDATWIPSVIRPERKEIMAAIAEMGVKTEPVWDYLPKRHQVPPNGIGAELWALVSDQRSADMITDQLRFRRNPDYSAQLAPDDINEIYWPEFILRRDDEHYVDCGAADGDTVKEFMQRWNSYYFITAIEPDPENFAKVKAQFGHLKNMELLNLAVGDREEEVDFTAHSDYSSHVGGDKYVQMNVLDRLWFNEPTFIKMDIEGSEPEALWGARRILRDHSPVLAICAYHEAEHFWTIPLLIHALNPAYKLFFRRYAEGAFEIVWYAVPPERVR